MKKHIIYLLFISSLFCFFSCNPFGAFWGDSDSDEFFGNIHTIYFINSKEGWGGGTYNESTFAIFHTTNAGNTWEFQYSYKHGDCCGPQYIHELYFTPSKEGWASGSTDKSGFSFHTLNGGKDWKLIETQIIPTKLFDGKNGFGGFLYKTTDGGYTWSDIAINIEDLDHINMHIDNVDIVSMDVVWVTTHPYKAVIWRTTNSGQTWEKKQIPPKKFSYIETISFIDSLNGFVAGPLNNDNYQQSIKIAITNDGGKTWNVQPVNEISYIYKDFYGSGGKMFSLSSIWLVSDNYLIHTINKGKNWRKIKDNTMPNPSYGSVFFLDPYHIWVFTISEGAYTIDDGNTWQKLDWNYIK